MELDDSQVRELSLADILACSGHFGMITVYIVCTPMTSIYIYITCTYST